jgi:aryl-alcohol dehydrogenase-like predicted oxidoreductase
MNYRSFGKTDLKVSDIGMGCSSLGGGLYHRDDRGSIRTLLKAFDHGINFYDTSDNYSQGKSERLIGQAFKDRRKYVVIASKVGTSYSSLGGLALRIRPLLRPVSQILHPIRARLNRMRYSQRHKDFSTKHLTEAIHESLKRLQTDYLDLYQLHNPPLSILQKGDFYGTLEKLKAQGKIRYYGVSCATVHDALLCLKYPGFSSIQVTINLLDQEAVTKLLPLAKEEKLAVIARVPLAQGLLTNIQKETKAEQIAKNQRELEYRKSRVKKFQFLVKKDRTLAQAALQFVLQLDGVSVVIPGMTKQKHLEENLGALTAPPLTMEELLKIQSTSRDAA